MRKVAVTLPDELYDLIERARAVEHRSRSEVVQEALRTHVGEPSTTPPSWNAGNSSRASMPLTPPPHSTGVTCADNSALARDHPSHPLGGRGPGDRACPLRQWRP
ncbi:ribbon-helix-helix protein, CopG family [Janibacter indicus]|uniref:Ribbon-helix-helix protein, CopG family n=1 Tax=Janibacter indicus TaxID=857417 RepID=A0A7L9IYV9_9MICO|nr:ribbon-helix-helix protein, CopG family [Janibacter indicus]